jgi:hypothetical protein
VQLLQCDTEEVPQLAPQFAARKLRYGGQATGSRRVTPDISPEPQRLQLGWLRPPLLSEPIAAFYGDKWPCCGVTMTVPLSDSWLGVMLVSSTSG